MKGELTEKGVEASEIEVRCLASRGDSSSGVQRGRDVLPGHVHESVLSLSTADLDLIRHEFLSFADHLTLQRPS